MTNEKAGPDAANVETGHQQLTPDTHCTRSESLIDPDGCPWMIPGNVVSAIPDWVYDRADQGDENTSVTAEMLAEYALAGSDVFFVQPSGKAPLCPLTARERKVADVGAQEAAREAGHTRWEKVSHQCGLYHATSDLDVLFAQMRRHIEMRGHVNLGIAIPGNKVVLDLDGRAGGRLEDLFGQMPDTLTDESGRRDGEHFHFWFKRPHKGRLSDKNLPDGWDLKQVGGYVVVPPSIHGSTRLRYRWVSMSAPTDLPEHIVRVITPPPPKPRKALPSGARRNASGLLKSVEQAKEGDRHATFFWAANRAVDEGLISDIEDQLIAAGEASGIEDSYMSRTIAAVWGAA